MINSLNSINLSNFGFELIIYLQKGYFQEPLKVPLQVATASALVKRGLQIHECRVD